MERGAGYAQIERTMLMDKLRDALTQQIVGSLVI
jgi:hypothetical protein